MAKKKKTDGGEEQVDGKKKKKKLWLVKVGAGGAAVFAVYTFVLGGGGGEAQAADATLPEPVEGVVLEAGEVRASLADEEPRFALVGMAVVLEEAADPAEVQNRLPILHDAAVTEVSSFTSEQLKGARGADLLRAALSERAEEIFNAEPEAQVQVMRVVLTELIVQ